MRHLTLLCSLLMFGCGDDAGGADSAVPDGSNDVQGDGVSPDGGSPDGDIAASCGDGRTEGDESCDGDDVACDSLSGLYSAGTASCAADCSGFDVSACTNTRDWEMVKPAMRNERWTNARCNDGTPFDFVYRPGAAGSTKWVIMLMGGGFGDDLAFPTADRPATLTSTTGLPDGVTGPLPDLEHGIFASETLNPDLHDAHFVFLHYCSSDFWAASNTERRPVTGTADGFYFAGRTNVQATLDILIERYGLDDSNPDLQVLFGGESAGCVGASQTADDVAARLPAAVAEGRLKILMDGAYILPIEIDGEELLWGASSLSGAETFSAAVDYWDATPNSACAAPSAGECFYGRHAYAALRALNLPTLVVQSTQDQVILLLRGNVCDPECGPGGPACTPGCRELAPPQLAQVRDQHRADLEGAGVEWFYMFGTPEHTTALTDDRWAGPRDADPQVRDVVGDFFLERTEPQQVAVLGAF